MYPSRLGKNSVHCLQWCSTEFNKDWCVKCLILTCSNLVVTWKASLIWALFLESLWFPCYPEVIVLFPLQLNLFQCVPKKTWKFRVNLAYVSWKSHAHQAYSSYWLEPRIGYEWNQYYARTFHVATSIIEWSQTMEEAKWQFGENDKSRRLKEEVGNLNFGYEITSLYLTENLAGGQLHPVLWRKPVDFLSQKTIIFLKGKKKVSPLLRCVHSFIWYYY